MMTTDDDDDSSLHAQNIISHARADAWCPLANMFTMTLLNQSAHFLDVAHLIVLNITSLA